MTVDQSIPQVYWGELAGGELPDNMQELRHYADRLEEKYSVSIRLSSQCAQPCQASGEEIVTTDQAGLDDEVGAIYQALEALDRTLALYPTASSPSSAQSWERAAYSSCRWRISTWITASSGCPSKVPCGTTSPIR